MWQCVACDTQNGPEVAACMVCHTARLVVPAHRPAPPVPFTRTPPRRRPTRVPRPGGLKIGWLIIALLVGVPMVIAFRARADPSSPGSASASAASPADQARAVAALIQDSSRSRAAVKDAVVATKACRSLRANAETFTAAGDARRAQRDRTTALDVSALPTGADLTGTLLRALDHSQRADRSFAAWATELADNGCEAGDTATTDFKNADRASTSATAEKKKFVALWNPVAKTYHLPEFIYSDV
jgi:hypothetical protein